MIDRFWTVRRAAHALHEGLGARGWGPGAQAFPDDRPLSRVWTDTRTIEPGDLFVALRGERFDAHNFLADAVKQGAAAVVVEDGEKAAGLGVPVLVVDNTLHALGALGRYHRTAWSRPVVAVGGSNGKTTTKEMIRSALSASLEVHATAANLNNQIGVPQTLLALPESADIAVLEVGTNQPGEIALLREMVQANIAVITTVQEEHLEGFGDLAGVIAEEMALCEGVQLAIVPDVEPVIVDEARKRAVKVVTVGLDGGDVRPSDWGLGAGGEGWMRFGDVRVDVPIPGKHNVANAALAMAVAHACGVSTADAARGITGVKLPPMRSAVRPLGDALLVNDAYNANPASMKAGLEMLAAVGKGRPLVAVLGTMREMGAATDSLHDDIARAALAGDVAVIGAVGEFANAFNRIAPGNSRVVAAPDADAIWRDLEPRLDKRAAILLKGSRGVRLERLVPHLETWAGVAQRTGQTS